MSPVGVLETVLYASDLERAERFYADVLGMSVLDRSPGHHVFFQSGQGVFLLFNPESSAVQTVQVNGVSIPQHGASGAGHVAFRIPSGEIAAWRDRLVQFSVPLEAEIHWPNGGHSLYFRDPAGNSVELATATLWGLSE